MTANTKNEVVEGFQPHDGNIIKIWRYMDLTKLVALLETGSLHFARADTLGDPYEGSWSRLNKAAEEQPFRQVIASLERVHPEVAEQINALLQSRKNTTHLIRKITYINCWHSGETESAAMWNLHGTTAGSIVIQSTYKKLMDALTDNFFMGMVQYKDYGSSEDWIPGDNLLYPFIHKRKEFEYESEVRAFTLSAEVLESGDDKQLGIAVDIDIDKVVETIRVQPTTPAWARESIEKLIKKYDWDGKVRPSQIDILPAY